MLAHVPLSNWRWFILYSRVLGIHNPSGWQLWFSKLQLNRKGLQRLSMICCTTILQYSEWLHYQCVLHQQPIRKINHRVLQIMDHVLTMWILWFRTIGLVYRQMLLGLDLFSMKLRRHHACARPMPQNKSNAFAILRLFKLTTPIADAWNPVCLESC